MNDAEQKGVKFLNNPVSSVSEAAMNNETREARKGIPKSKNTITSELRAGINNPRPAYVKNRKETANLTAALRGLNAHREAFLNHQQFLSQEMARAALAAHAAAEARNKCRQQGGTRKIKRKSKARRSHSYKYAKTHRSR